MKNKKTLTIVISFIVLCLTLGTLIVYDNYKIDITEYNLENDNLPESFNELKIIHLSDLHNTEFGKDNEKLLRIIKEQEPDAVFVTGDTIDGFYTNIQIPINLFKEILEICDVYFIDGNHESRANVEAYRQFLQTLFEIGVNVLKDDSAYIEKNNEQIQIIGINDASFYKADYKENYKSEITKTINELDNKNCFSILLSHHPELFPEYKNTDIDLVFSGHAHGGQFRLPYVGGLFAPHQGFFPEYDSGLFTEQDTNMLVSRGVGNSLFPFRINNRPEIIIAELKAK